MVLIIDCDLKKLKTWVFKDSWGISREEFFAKNLDELTDEAALRKYIYGISGKTRIRAIAFRILFGGDYFKKAELIDSNFFSRFKRLTIFFPFYVPTMLEVLKRFLKIFKKIPLIAFFETAFFTKLPDEEKYYALPFEYYKNTGIKKWGFHGIFHESNAQMFIKRKKVVSVVMDKQTTVCSIMGNSPFSVSMGYTPLEGIMSRRSCGDIDPGIIFYLMNVHNFSIYQIDEVLKNESGFFGVTSYDIGFTDMLKLRGRDARIDLAFDMYKAQIIKHIGEAVTLIGGLDVVVFAGEYLIKAVPLIREIIKQISFLGIHTLGLTWDGDNDMYAVTSKESKVEVYMNIMGLSKTIYYQSIKFLHNSGIRR
jgi:acetate kinase